MSVDLAATEVNANDLDVADARVFRSRAPALSQQIREALDDLVLRATRSLATGSNKELWKAVGAAEALLQVLEMISGQHAD